MGTGPHSNCSLTRHGELSKEQAEVLRSLKQSSGLQLCGRTCVASVPSGVASLPWVSSSYRAHAADVSALLSTSAW